MAAIRDAKILTEISVGENGDISVATSDAESEDPANVVTLSPTEAVNITNPLNGELVEVRKRSLISIVNKRYKL